MEEQKKKRGRKHIFGNIAIFYAILSECVCPTRNRYNVVGGRLSPEKIDLPTATNADMRKVNMKVWGRQSKTEKYY